MTFPDWRGRTVACLASGPSLTAEDCERVRLARLPTIVTNTTYRLCPWADAVFGYDSDWWTWHLADVRKSFLGLRFTHGGNHGRLVLSAKLHPRYRDFGNSGACAISLAIACGAARIVMLGYDCALTGGRTHHHAPHGHGLRNCDTLPRWPKQFAALARHAAQMGVEVLNASRLTALTCFPRVTLDGVLADAHDARLPA